MAGADLLFLLDEQTDGIYQVIPRIPSDGHGRDCWWENELTGARGEKAKVYLGKQVRVVNILNSDQGRFIKYEDYSNALRAGIKKSPTG